MVTVQPHQHRVSRLAASRLPFLVLAGTSLMTGLAGGLARIGASTPAGAAMAAGHGVLMASGFLGTVIALERAVALRRPWGYAAPGLAGLGALAQLLGAGPSVVALLLAAAAAWLLAAYAAMWQLQPATHVAVQALGALAWWGASIRSLTGAGLPDIAPWLAAFVILTIVGERLELSRVGFLSSKVQAGLVGASALVGGGLLLQLLDASAGMRVFGAGLVALTVWLARYDVARRTIRIPGLTRYMAACLLAGYAWLGVAGCLWLGLGAVVDGPAYDATLHAVFLGFAISMVFGHAPVILPAVLRIRLPHHRRDYVVLALLHISLLVRLAAGDGLAITALRVAGGIGGAAALLAFIASSALSSVGAARTPDTTA